MKKKKKKRERSYTSPAEAQSNTESGIRRRPLEATLRIFLRTNTVTSTAIVYYLQREGVSVTFREKEILRHQRGSR